MTDEELRAKELREVTANVISALIGQGTFEDVEYSEDDEAIHAYDHLTEHTISISVEFA